MSAPVLIYPEPSKPYVLYTDSSKYTLAGILTQTYTYTDTVIQQVQTIDLPITFQSGSYSSSQEKWSTIQKEAYAIYASFKKMVFYLRDAYILIRSDHASLRKFIHCNTTNGQLTAWAQGLFAILPHIEFKHLKGSQNILSDASMRIKRLPLYKEIISIPKSQSDALLPASPSQDKLEIPIFDQDVTWQLHNVIKETMNGFMLNDTWYEIDKMSSEKYLPLNDLMTTKTPSMVQLKLSTESLRKLQATDKQHSKIGGQLLQGQEHPAFMLDDRETLYQKVCKYFQAVLLPEKLRKHIMFELHDCFGHPGTNKLYNCMQKYYYWPGIKQDCNKYMQSCKACLMVNLKFHRLTNLSMPISRIPMEMICMDLIGPLPETNPGNKFALTAISLLTNHMFMVPIQDKTTQVIQAYQKHIYAQFGGSRYILTDRGSEFTSQLMHQLASELGFTLKGHINS